MPQLPSGSQLAISPSLLDDLARAGQRTDNIHKIMGSTSISDLYPYVEVLGLTPCADAGETEQRLHPSSNRLPPEQTFVPAGYRLSEWEANASD